MALETFPIYHWLRLFTVKDRAQRKQGSGWSNRLVVYLVVLALMYVMIADLDVSDLIPSIRQALGHWGAGMGRLPENIDPATRSRSLENL